MFHHLVYKYSSVWETLKTSFVLKVVYIITNEV